MAGSIEFEYEWRGLTLLCEATFEGEYHPAVTNPDAPGFGPAEYPELTDLYVCLADELGNDDEFDTDGLFESVEKPWLIWPPDATRPMFSDSKMTVYSGHYFRATPTNTNPGGVWEFVSLTSMLEEKANELYEEE